MHEPMDFTGMKPSDALEKAHEALPHVTWDWSTAHGDHCCAVGLLAQAIGVVDNMSRYSVVARTFGELPLSESDNLLVNGDFAISVATQWAKSFPEAIAMLRERG